MIICEEKKFIFIRNPKTASRSTSQFFLSNFRCLETNKYHAIKIPQEYKNFIIYITIRNPYSRAVSAWRHIVDYRKKHQNNENLEFLRYLNNKNFTTTDSDCDFNFFYQADLIKEFKKYSYRILYFENLSNCLNTHFKIFFNLRKIGESNFNWRDCYKNNNDNYFAENCLKKDIKEFKFYGKIY